MPVDTSLATQNSTVTWATLTVTGPPKHHEANRGREGCRHATEEYGRTLNAS